MESDGRRPLKISCQARITSADVMQFPVPSFLDDCDPA